MNKFKEHKMHSFVFMILSFNSQYTGPFEGRSLGQYKYILL